MSAVGGGRRQVGVHDGLQRRRGEVVERGEGVHRDPREVGKLGMAERVVASLGRTEKTHVNRCGSSRGEERDWDGAWWKGVVPGSAQREDAREWKMVDEGEEVVAELATAA